jgi:hypothetical protein
MNPLISLDRLAALLDDLDAQLPADVAAVQELRGAVAGIVHDKPGANLAADIVAGAIDARTIRQRVIEAAHDVIAHDAAARIAQDLDPIIDRRERTALAANGDAIVAAVRPRFDDAIAALVAFHEHFGRTWSGDTTAETVLAAGPEGAALWHRQQTALATLDNIARVARTLQAARYWGEPEVAWYLPTLANQADLSAAVAAFSQGWPAFIAAGFTPRLNTADEARALVDTTRRHDLEQTQRQQNADDERHQRDRDAFIETAMVTNTTPPWAPLADDKHPGTTKTKAKP